MKFYLLDIEEKDNNGIFIYAKELEAPYTLTIISVSGINNVHLYRKYFEGAQKSTFKNFFYPDLPPEAEFYVFEATKENLKLNLGEPCIKMYTNPIENFILQRGIKGPGIIEVAEFKQIGKNSIQVSSPKHITFVSHDKFPPLRYITFDFDHKNEIPIGFRAKISCEGVDKYFLAKTGVPNDTGDNPTTTVNCNDLNLIFKDSKSLIDHFNWILSSSNPDVLIFYNLPEFIIRKVHMKGRLCCDIYQTAINELKGRDFTLGEIANTLKIPNDAEDCLEVCNIDLLSKIFYEMKILELSKELTEICGNLLNRSLKNFRAERVEFLLLHECAERKILFPPKRKINEFNYKGGLVLEPKLGFYETFILLLDFNSLYPSIIQEYNICFSTINKFNWDPNNIGEEDLKVEPIEIGGLAIIPSILKNIVNRRKNVKEMIKREKSPVEINKLDIRQKALKLTANSIYGCLGSSKTRFVSIAMASLITYLGRMALKSAIATAETLNLDVIYGDTDSIMIDTHLEGSNTNEELAKKTIEHLKDQINKKYKYIEIEVDKIFKKLLILKKKKYGALVYNKSGSYLEFKGVDFLRRDYCLISCKICRSIFELMLSDFEENESIRTLIENEIGIPAAKSTDTAVASRCFALNNGNRKLNSLILKKINEAKISIYNEPIDSFTINSSLSRNPDKYMAGKSLPHVSLALRLNEKGHNFKKDDVISYVVGEGRGPISNRVFLKNEIFEIDYDYYISNQILPPLIRLLGGSVDFPIDKVNLLLGNISETVRIDTTQRLRFACPECEEPISICKKCSKCDNQIPSGFFMNKVIDSLREKMSLLYSTPSECEGVI